MWVVAVGLLLLVIILSLGPSPAGVDIFDLSDAILHALGYAGLTAAWLMAIVRRPGRSAGPLPAGAPVVVTAILATGIAIEIIQPAFGRVAQVADVLADAVGAAIGVGVWAALTTRGGRRKPQPHSKPAGRGPL